MELELCRWIKYIMASMLKFEWSIETQLNTSKKEMCVVPTDLKAFVGVEKLHKVSYKTKWYIGATLIYSSKLVRMIRLQFERNDK